MWLFFRLSMLFCSGCCWCPMMFCATSPMSTESKNDCPILTPTPNPRFPLQGNLELAFWGGRTHLGPQRLLRFFTCVRKFGSRQKAPENATHPKTQIIDRSQKLRFCFRVCRLFGCFLFPSKRAPKHTRKRNIPENADSGNGRAPAFSGVLRFRVLFGALWKIAISWKRLKGKTQRVKTSENLSEESDLSRRFRRYPEILQNRIKKRYLLSSEISSVNIFFFREVFRSFLPFAFLPSGSFRIRIAEKSRHSVHSAPTGAAPIPNFVCKNFCLDPGFYSKVLLRRAWSLPLQFLGHACPWRGEENQVSLVGIFLLAQVRAENGQTWVQQIPEGVPWSSL